MTILLQKEGREPEDDIVQTPKMKSRKSETDLKKKTPKKTPEDGLRKRLNILYKVVYEYTVSSCLASVQYFLIIIGRVRSHFKKYIVYRNKYIMILKCFHRVPICDLIAFNFGSNKHR